MPAKAVELSHRVFIALLHPSQQSVIAASVAKAYPARTPKW
jgi:hypothetical protein